MPGRKSIATVGVTLLASTALAACGSSSKPKTTSSTSPVVTPSEKTGSASAKTVEAVAHVESAPISKSSYEHWLAVERALGEKTRPGHRALGFLISSSWVLGEAAQRHISVSESEVKKRLTQLEQKSFPKKGQLAAYLARSHQTEVDLIARVKVELLQGRISEAVTKGVKEKKAREAALASFQKHFVAHWKPLTSCEHGYVMEDCKEYKGGPEPGVSSYSGSSANDSGTASASSDLSASSSASSSGEVYRSPGAFAISSPTFERNGQIPTKYTCAGTGVSPPLQWSKVPKGASELVLFVIDDSASGSEGGIRWIVAGIDPSSSGVQAGQTPSGAVVGTNTAGKVSYSPICPAAGKTDTIEFVMYALKHPISLSSGFEPAVAEHDYGSTKDLLGEAAVTYAVATGR